MLDRLIVRSANGVSRSTVYDGSHVWADFAADGQVESRYLFGSEPDELAARWRPSEGVRWYLTDRQGSVVALAAGDGTVVNRIDYTAFGSAIESNPSAGV